MAYQTPGAFNLFSQLDDDLRIMFARNPRKMPLARYALFGDLNYQVSYYTKIDSTVGIKLPGRNKYAAIWADGQNRPDGQANRISHRFESIKLERHLHNFPQGTISLANQPYDIISNNMFLMAQRAGTLRALWAYLEIYAAVTASEIATATLGSIVSGATDISAGTVTNPIFLKVLQYCSQYIHQHTNGVVNEQYLKVVMGPDVALKLGASAELLDYVARSSSARDVLEKGFSNNRFGLPLEYHGYELIVEDTVLDSGNVGTNTLANVFTADDIWVLARMDANMGSGIDAGAAGSYGGAEGNVFPTTFSTLSLMEGPFWTLQQNGKTEVRDGTHGMGSEMHVDTKNEVVDAAIRDTFATKVTAGASGFVVTDVLP